MLVNQADIQPMTISDYCKKRKVNQRYLRRIVTANKRRLLNNVYGVVSYQIFGKTYILNVQNGFENLPENKVFESVKINKEPKTNNQAQPENITKPTSKSNEPKAKIKPVEPKVSKRDYQKKSRTIISLTDAKNMVAMDVASCTTEILKADGTKEVTVFKSVSEAIKKRKSTGSNNRIWVWNNETSDLLYIVDDKGKVY